MCEQRIAHHVAEGKLTRSIQYQSRKAMSLLSWWCHLKHSTSAPEALHLTPSRVEGLLEGGACRQPLVVLAHIREPLLVIQLQA